MKFNWKRFHKFCLLANLMFLLISVLSWSAQAFSETYSRGEKITYYDDGTWSSENYHTYLRWDGAERPFEELNVMGGTGYYYPSENATYYDLIRLNDRISLPKNSFITYTFNRTKISMNITALASKVADISQPNGSGQRRIKIPESIKPVGKLFNWDNKIPEVILRNATWNKTVSVSDLWYSKDANGLWFNFKTVNVTGLAPDVYASFIFRTWEICGSGCDASWSGNSSLDNVIIPRCDNTKLALQYEVKDYWSRWDFCEKTGTTVYDENATTNHNGVFQNQASWNATGGIDFDGVDDYIRLPGNDFESLQYQGTIVVDAFVKTIGGTAYATVRNSMFGQPSGGDNIFGFAAGTNHPVFRGGIGGNLTGNTTVANGTRHTFKVTWNNTPSYTQKLYLDDILIADTTVTLGWQGGNAFNSTIGRVYTSSTAGSFNGTIHRVGVWRRSLSSTEVANAFNHVSFGNITTWKDVGANNETYQIDVNRTGNYSVYYRQNQTGNMVLLGQFQTGNNSYTLSTKYQDTEVNVTVYDNGTEHTRVKFWSQAVSGGTLPNITSWGNNKTNNNSLSITINTSEGLNLNATANQTITTWNWYKDDASQSNNYNNYTTSWSSAGTQTIKTNATNSNGTSNTITWTVTVNDVAQPTYMPPTPVSCSATTGNFWVNTSCSAGTGNITNSMNFTNSTLWINGTNFFANRTLSSHAWSNESIYAFNNSGASTLNQTPATLNTQIPNNAISISNISASYSITEGQQLYIDANYADADSDTGTFARNFSQGSFNTGTGVLTWNTVDGDQGTYNWQINVTDGYGSVAMANFTVTVSDSTPTSISNLTNTTGNFYINWTWNAGDHADDYDIQINSTDVGYDNTTRIYNATYSAHATRIISVRSHNHTLDSYSAWVNQTTTIPNNAPTQNSIGNKVVDEGSWLNFTISSSDGDGDALTYGTNASKGTLTTNTFTWNTTYSDSGTYYWTFNTTDNYSAVATETITVTVNNVKQIPPVPVINSTMTGNFFVNTSWTAGSGNITNGYNSTNGTTWINSTFIFRNTTLSAHAWQNLTVYAWNSTDNVLSSTALMNNTQIPNNVISISGISSSYNINEGDTLNIDANYTDADIDTGTFDDNSSQWNVNSGTGIVTWVTGYSDSGTYNWLINVTDGYGSIATSTFTVTVNNVEVETLPPSPINLTNVTGNFFVNHSWQAGTGNITNSYNVSVNGTWTNGSSNIYKNTSGMSPHGWANISVYAFNNSGSGTLNQTSISQNTQIPNNVPVLASIGNKNADEGTWLNFTVSGTDTDGDSLTCATNATKGTLSSCNFNWSISYTDAGTYNWNFNISDNYGGIDDETITVTVNNAGAPNITSWDSNKDNASQTITINISETLNLNITTNQSLNPINWTKDNVEQYNNSLNANFSWDKSGRRNVSVNGSNINSSTQILNFTIEVRSNITNRYDTIADSYTDWSFPNTNFGNETKIIVGSYVDPGLNEYGWFNFSNISGYANDQISAKLYIYMTIPDLPSGNVVLRQVLGSWNESGITHNNMPNADADNQITSETLVSGWNNITITDFVKSWNNGSVAMNGVELIAPLPQYKEFLSRKNLTVNASYIQITLLQQPNEFIPPAPTNLAQTNNSIGFWINYTWLAGSGNITNSYNVSVNGTWANGSANNFSNGAVNPHGWRNITVWAFNSSGNGSLSGSSVSMNTRIQNNAPILASIGNKNIHANNWLNFTISGTDLDNDVLTYATNTSKGSFNATTGNFNWSVLGNEAGTYYFDYNVTDNYSAVDNEVIIVTVTADAPNITSWSSTTNSTNLTITIPRNTNVTFNLTANQSVNTTWNNGTVSPTKINGTNENISYAYYNFTSAGTFTIIPQCSNANGTCTNPPTWTITVITIGGLNLTIHVENVLGLSLENAKVELNNGNFLFTGVNGYANFSNINEGTYTVLARAITYRNSTNSSTISSDTTINFTLQEKGNVASPQTSGFTLIISIISISSLYYIHRRKKWK